jgi:hypothetical protein
MLLLAVCGMQQSQELTQMLLLSNKQASCKLLLALTATEIKQVLLISSSTTGSSV